MDFACPALVDTSLHLLNALYWMQHLSFQNMYISVHVRFRKKIMLRSRISIWLCMLHSRHLHTRGCPILYAKTNSTSPISIGVFPLHVQTSQTNSTSFYNVWCVLAVHYKYFNQYITRSSSLQIFIYICHENILQLKSNGAYTFFTERAFYLHEYWTFLPIERYDIYMY